MAVQNAVRRMHLGAAPPSIRMTGTTTQIVLDLADRIYPPRQRKPTRVAARPDVHEHFVVPPVCTENLIRVAEEMESPKLAE
jgi:uncharacterized membrane protein YoaK (UPF0700 family)